jgi:hypothetical protein
VVKLCVLDMSFFHLAKKDMSFFPYLSFLISLFNHKLLTLNCTSLGGVLVVPEVISLKNAICNLYLVMNELFPY